MARGRSLRRAVGDLTRNGLTARNCGARMYRAGWDWAATIVAQGVSIEPHLTDAEREAWNVLLPASFMAQWWRGWNDAAADDTRPES